MTFSSMPVIRNGYDKSQRISLRKTDSYKTSFPIFPFAPAKKTDLPFLALRTT